MAQAASFTEACKKRIAIKHLQKNFMFNAETHFLSRCKKENASSDLPNMNVWLGNTSYTRARKEELSSEKMKYVNISLDVAKQLHSMFSAHVRDILSSSLKVSMLALLAKIELIGAEASPLRHCVPEKEHSKGIIVNETKNTLAISINGVVKIFPKSMYNFFIYVEGKTYFLIGPALRIERKYAK